MENRQLTRELLELILENPLKYNPEYLKLSPEEKEIVIITSNLNIQKWHKEFYTKHPTKIWEEEIKFLCDRKIQEYQKLIDDFFNDKT